MKTKETGNSGLTRRQFLRTTEGLVLLAPLAAAMPQFTKLAWAQIPQKPSTAAYSGSDNELLDEIERSAFRFFWEEANPKTGFVKDRAKTDGTDTYTVASVASTGFGLTALCIGDTRGYKPRKEIRDRVLTTLQSTFDKSEGHNGFYYHFVDWETGKRAWKCELSSIDTAILLCGVLTARQYFHDDAQIVDFANKINGRVQWRWMLDGGDTLSMGWKPESGFLDARWSHYSELMMMYLLGMGALSDPLPANTWSAWSRPTYTYQGITYISSGDPLFTHQFSHAWFDFRNKSDAYADYFENSVKATQAHKLFCLSLKNKFPTYSADQWGITSSDSEHGYVAWGGPPPMGPIDGTVVPCAPGGSIAFRYDDCMAVLRKARTAPGVWDRYGYTDAFNPGNGWVNPDVIGINVGITMLMVENHRTGFVWKTFMNAPEVQKGMRAAGFHESHAG